jgi:hypothetical protein
MLLVSALKLGNQALSLLVPGVGIGMPGFGVVPLFVIGTHVVIGFDDAAGREILNHISDCPKRECRDIVHDLIREPSEVEQAALALYIPPPLCKRSLSNMPQ